MNSNDAKTLEDIVKYIRQHSTCSDYNADVVDFADNPLFVRLMAFVHTGNDSILVVYKDGSRKYMSLMNGTVDSHELQRIYSLLSQTN